MSKTVGIIGLGLLGGSLAKALKAYTDYEVVGYARRQEVCDAVHPRWGGESCLDRGRTID